MTQATRYPSIREAMKGYKSMNGKKIAAAYLRNSDASKKDDEEFAVQLDAIRKYCKEQDYDLPDHLIFRDAMSSTKYPYWDRKGIMALWDTVEKGGQFQVAVCTEFWRFARNGNEQAAIAQHLKRHGSSIESVTEKYDDTDDGQLLKLIGTYLGGLEAQKIKIRTSRGKRFRAEHALTGQGYPTYGYSWMDGKNYTKEYYVLNTTIVHKDALGKEWTEGDVVVFIYESCLRGMSTRTIALTLTQMGIPTRKGQSVWNKTTVRQILTNVNYTGEAYNWRWSRVDKKSSTKRLPVEGEIKLPDNTFPKIIEADTFKQVQAQLKSNSENSPRHNKHPEIGIMRGRVYCGVCNNKMHVAHHAKPNTDHLKPQRSEYVCKRNEGTTELRRFHAVTSSVHLLDPQAWEFACTYLRNPELLREYLAKMRDSVTIRDHAQDIEEQIKKIDKSIRSLYKVAEITDPDDEEGVAQLQERVNTLQVEKRNKERLLAQINNKEEREQKFLEAMDKFESWANTFRPFLEDPHYEAQADEMRDVVKFLGVKAVVWPLTPDYPKRVEFTLRPPDLNEYCGANFTIAASQRNPLWGGV